MYITSSNAQVLCQQVTYCHAYMLPYMAVTQMQRELQMATILYPLLSDDLHLLRAVGTKYDAVATCMSLLCRYATHADCCAEPAHLVRV